MEVAGTNRSGSRDERGKKKGKKSPALLKMDKTKTGESREERERERASGIHSE